MTREDVLQALRDLEGDLRARHVVHAGLFGSRARGDERPDSDVDIVLKFNCDAEVGFFDFVGVARYVRVLLRRRLGRRVDVVDHEGLRPRMRDRVDRDAHYAF